MQRERDEQRPVGATKSRRASAFVGLALVALLFGGATWWVQRGANDDDDARATSRRQVAPTPVPLADAPATAQRTPDELVCPIDETKTNSSSNSADPSDPSDPPREFHVRLFDEADGQPVAHASLLVSRFSVEALANTTTQWGPEPALLIHSGLQPFSEGAAATARSDDAGDAVLATPSKKLLCVDVLAKGYAPVWFTTDVAHDARERPLSIGLAKTASLSIFLFGEDRRPAAGIRLLLQFDRRALERPRRPFGSMLTGSRGQCEAVTDANGRYCFDALPADVALTLDIGTDEEPMRAWQQCLWLDPGEQRMFTSSLAPATSVSGRVVSADGTPVAAATVELVSAAQGISRATTTDEIGAFRIARAPIGMVVLQVDPNQDSMGATALALSLDREDRAGVEVRLRAAAPLVVRAFDPDGRPAYPSEVTLFPPLQQVFDSGRGVADRPDRDGARRIPSVPLGNLVVRVRAPLISDWPEVETSFRHDGLHECEVKFGAGGRMRGRIVDALDRDRPVAAAATILRRDPSRRIWRGQTMESMVAPGTFDFTSLAEGVYDVLAQSDDGRVGVAPNLWLGAGERRDDVVVPLAPGATLELLAPDSGRSIRFEARSGSTLVGAAFAPPLGRTHLTVPPGPVTIEAIAAGEVIDTKEVEARLDQVVRVKF